MSCRAGVYGRAYGFERAMDNLGAIGGPLLALALVAAVGVRTAILLSIIPGLLAVAGDRLRDPPRAAADGARATADPPARPPGLRGRLGRLLIGGRRVRVRQRRRDTADPARDRAPRRPGRGSDDATQIALALYVVYNLAATLASIPAGHLGRPARAWSACWPAGWRAFALAYAGFAATGREHRASWRGFALAGVGIGCVETAEHAAVATLAADEIRGSAFGLLAAVQSFGNLAASAVAGLLYTVASPAAAFGYAAVLMGASLVALLVTMRARRDPAAPVGE